LSPVHIELRGRSSGLFPIAFGRTARKQQDKKNSSHKASRVRFSDYSLPTSPLLPPPGFELVAFPAFGPGWVLSSPSWQKILPMGYV
jgi:hypothetical protein